MPNNFVNSHNNMQDQAITPASMHSGYIDISHLNTMALSCQARQVVKLHDVNHAINVLQALKETQVPFIILSNGSNTILPPILEATVLTPQIMGETVIHEDDDSITLEVMAGENWHELVVRTVSRGWYGLENLALIPSWVGAAPVQNIGAYGVQLSDVVSKVTAIHIPTLKVCTLNNAECLFTYRDSIFKQQAGDWLIISVQFCLHKSLSVNLNYGDVAKVAHIFAQEANRSEITPFDVMQAIITIRQEKIPDTRDLPNCGSFFKNPIVSNAEAEQLRIDYPTLVSYPVLDSQGNLVATKLGAGWLIDKAGLKGKGIFPILTHVNQALVLTNHAPNESTAADIECTMHLIQKTVKEKFAVSLHPEPVWIEGDGHIRQYH